MTASRYRTTLVSSLLALGQLCAAPQTFGQDTDRFRPSTVQDLAYGEVLFHFYQEDYFTALTQLLVAQARDEFSYHDGEAELLLGGLYLSYGLHRHAGEIFNRLLEQSVEPSLHDRAWFFLAKIWYQRGYLEQSEQALARIGTNLPAELRQERHMLEARVLMEQGRFDDDAGHRVESWVGDRIEGIPRRLMNILQSAQAEGCSTDVVARRKAMEIVRGQNPAAAIAA